MDRITTRFGFSSTAEQVAAGIDLSGRKAVVTGGAAGIGLETARVLCLAGAEVTLAVRDVAKGEAAASTIRQSTRNPHVYATQLDLADRRTIRAFARSWEGPLHILINNAGIMALPQLERTPDGWELQFATNFLGHFELFLGLHAALTAAKGARVVVLSSSGHLFSPVIFDDLFFNFVRYDPITAYAQSKSATALFAVEASRRGALDGITANAVMPGAIATGLQRHAGGLKTPKQRQKNVEQGAATTLLVATSAQLDGIGGRYFEDCNEAVRVKQRNRENSGVAAYALDPENAARLWDIALGLLGQPQG